jgi:isochorismate synthase
MTTRLRAVTRPLERDVDLNSVAGGTGLLFVRDGVGLAGQGVAVRVPAGEVGALLDAMERDDTVGRPGCGPVAFGALPFRPGRPAELVVPALVVGKAADGSRWCTTITAPGASPAELTVAEAPPPSAAAFTIRPGFSPDAFRAAVATGRDAVRAGRLTKVVLARDVLVEADRPLDVHGILLRLKASFGSSYRYSVDGFVGASPELLVERQDRMVRSHPLAGTAPRTGDPATDARLAAQLIASTKDQVEHRVVIEVVNDTLLPYCSYLDWEPEPSIVTVANVQHLGTAVEGRLSAPPPNVLELVRALQPTPALGGHPRADALALIDELEGWDRGRYGGAVGWVDADGNGTWAVAIRCAEIRGRTARLFAGVGVVAGSDPDAELAETQAKLQAMLSALIRP